MKVRANINNGIIFEVINKDIWLYCLELNKYFIPTKVFNEKIDEICKTQQGVFVEKILRVKININGKKVSIYLFSLLWDWLNIVPIIAKKLHGRNVAGIFHK